jgi:hypothetical protein
LQFGAKYFPQKKESTQRYADFDLLNCKFDGVLSGITNDRSTAQYMPLIWGKAVS